MRALGRETTIAVFTVLLAVGLVLGGCVSTTGPGSEVGKDPLTRGLEAHAAGQLDNAVNAYFEALAQHPRDKFAYYNLGQIAQMQNHLAAAESFYRLALDVDPTLRAALFNLAIVRANRGEVNDAIDLYRRAIALDANDAAARFNLGLLLRANGSRTDGEAQLARARQLDPMLVAPNGGAPP